jgi:hypothetical protein
METGAVDERIRFVLDLEDEAGRYCDFHALRHTPATP